MTSGSFVLVESNTTGTGRDFAVAAARRGLRPVLLASDPGRYPYVDELDLPVHRLDTNDVDEVTTVCRRLAPAGITSSSEYFVRTAAAVAARLGLPAQDPDAIARCRDKAAQRRYLRAAGVAVPDFIPCRSAIEAEQAAFRLAGPVVVKPVHGTGSEAVRLCANPGSARWWAARVLNRRHRVPVTELLVERVVTGPEFSVEILDGAPVGVTRKHVSSPPYFVELGHDYPASLSPAEHGELCATAVEAVRAVGHLTGPAHVELRLPSGGEATVIEINPRLAGGLIPRLIQLATGRDLVDDVVAAAAGQPVAARLPRERFASIRFLLPRQEGLVAAVEGTARASALPGVAEVLCRLGPGSDVRFEHSFVDRKGHVIATGSTAEDAIRAAREGIAAIQLRYVGEPADTTVA